MKQDNLSLVFASCFVFFLCALVSNEVYQAHKRGEQSRGR